MGDFLQINIFSIKVCIYVICVRFVKNTMNLFNVYFLNVLMLCIFRVGFDRFFSSHFSNKDYLFYFIKNDASHLFKFLQLAVITISIWMIWHMRNYAIYQDKIDVSRAISVIKDLTCVWEIRLKLQRRMICWISMSLSFFVLILVLVRFFVLFLLDESFFVLFLLDEGISWFYYLWRHFLWEYEGVYWCFLCVSWCSNCYGCRVLWSYTCHGGSSKDGILVLYALNVLLLLLLGLMFRGCFVIDGILVLIIVGKSGLGLLIFFVKGMCADKLANLRFIRRESFHWYNRHPSSLFLKILMNRYTLPMYRFC